MTHCSVFDCNNELVNNTEVSYSSLPSSKQRKDALLVAVKREKDNLPRKIFVCSDHFEEK